MGRRSEMEMLVERLAVSEAARERTKVILLTLSGGWSVRQGFERLGLSRTRFQDLRRRMLDGAAHAVEGRPAGRPRREEQVEPETVESMRGAIRQLEHELRSARAELAIARSGAARAVAARLAGRVLR